MRQANGERIDVRLPATMKDRLRKIAALSGRSMSDFIIAAAMEKAEEVAASIERWELNAEDSHAVLEALFNPSEILALRRLFAQTASPDDAKRIEA